jgi:hypothetical protein
MGRLAKAADVTVDWNIVGRIGEDQVRTLVAQQVAQGLGISRFAAGEAMTPSCQTSPAAAKRHLRAETPFSGRMRNLS